MTVASLVSGNLDADNMDSVVELSEKKAAFSRVGFCLLFSAAVNVALALSSLRCLDIRTPSECF